MKTMRTIRRAAIAMLLSVPQWAMAQSGNYFAGLGAGSGNTTGTGNTYVGEYAGTSYNASYNSFFGNAAGFENLGNGCSFIGVNAGFWNRGNANCFVGENAGRNNRYGQRNVFMGNSVGTNNVNANNNTFVGHESGLNNTQGDVSETYLASANSFFGYQSGYSNIGGFNNAFIGATAGYNNLSGTYNAFLGYQAGYNNTKGEGNTCSGYLSGQYNTTGNYNSYFGYLARPSNTQPNLINATAIGSRAIISKSNSLVLGCISGRNGATANVNVGIGTDVPGYRLHLNASDAAKVGGGPWTAASDRRLKQDIEDFTDGLALVERIRPVWFRYNGKAGITETQKRFVGVIAQEMQKVAPYTIGEFRYQDSTGKEEQYLDYDANALTYILVNSVKEQQQQIKALQSQNQVLQAKLSEMEALKAELAQIKALLLTPSTSIKAAGSGSQLFQNVPNPFQHSTTIRYVVPENAASAQLRFYTTAGQEVHAIELTHKGAGSITLENKRFASGTYLYQLVVDGHAIASKKLVLSK